MFMLSSVVMVPKIPIIFTGNGVVDLLIFAWAIFSGVLGLGMIKCIGTPWSEISIWNKLGLLSLIIYLIFIASCS